ncbi:MAG TPA: IS1634 family transposase, partial [Firmicutes bacterium]|nr:IS1634 family transposase [Bacillota bacterium]
MYIRTTKRKNKDGSVTEYVQLAHNVWDPKAGCAKARVLYSFGRTDDLDVEAIRRLVKSASRFLEPGEACSIQAGGPEEVRVISTKPVGGAWVLDSLWKELGIDKALGVALSSRGFTTQVERAIFAMVADRALAPSSKLAMEEWVERDVVIPGLPSCQVQQLYRAMDFLLECSDEIQKAVFISCAHLLNLEVDLIYFDATSTYFEVDDEDAEDDPKSAIRRRGHSKDHRDDLPQIVIGLAVTREGIPIRCWCWPGNSADMSVIQEVKNDLVGWKLGRVISVVDRGFASEENLRYLQRAGGHYIAGEPLRRGISKVEEALSRQGRYSKVKDNLEVKEIIVGDGEARTRYILVRNPEEAKQDKERRDKVISELREKLSSIKKAPKSEHTKAICALISSPKYGRYLKDTKKGLPKIDNEKIREEEKLDGKYLVRTSDDTLSVED